MTENGKSQIQTIGSAMMGFILVVGVGALVLTSRGGSSKAPSSASHPSAIPVAPAAEQAQPAVALPPAAPSSETAAAAPSAASALPAVRAGDAVPESAPVATAAPRPAALVVTQHLDATQTTSAKTTVAAAPAAKKRMEPLPTREFVTPKLVSPRNGSIASSVHYGVSSRSELMGRAAGPVYNFKGRGAKKAEAGDSKISGSAATQIEDVQKQLESSNLDEKSKKDLREKFQLINDSVGKTGSN